MTIQEEIKQTRPFERLEEEALVSVARTSSLLDRALAAMLKPFDITPTQYNILRILRGSKDTGLCRHEIASRMIAQVPDVTRLLDRMEEAELIKRTRGTDDRRVVRTEITEKGVEVLDKVSKPLAEWHTQFAKNLGSEELRELVKLLDKVRSII
jgi:DNA-binding MarR family transcriptional regulator